MGKRQLIVGRKPLKLDQDSITVREALVVAGKDPATCDVFLLENEGEDGEPIELDAVLDLSKPGKPVRLRCPPNDQNAGG